VAGAAVDDDLRTARAAGLAWPHCDPVVSAHSLAALDDLLAALAADVR
jgi:hypothetical protein